MVVVGLVKSIAWVGKLLRVVMGLLMVVRLELNKWVVMGLLRVVRLELNSGPSVLLMEPSLVLENRDVSVLVMEPSLVLENRDFWVLLMEPSLVLENSSVRFFSGQMNSSQMSARSGWVVFTLERKLCQVSADLRVLLLVICSEA